MLEPCVASPSLQVKCFNRGGGGQMVTIATEYFMASPHTKDKLKGYLYPESMDVQKGIAKVFLLITDFPLNG